MNWTTFGKDRCKLWIGSLHSPPPSHPIPPQSPLHFSTPPHPNLPSRYRAVSGCRMMPVLSRHWSGLRCAIVPLGASPQKSPQTWDRTEPRSFTGLFSSVCDSRKDRQHFTLHCFASEKDKVDTEPARVSELRSCVKVEVDVLGYFVPNKAAVSVELKQHFNFSPRLF